MFDLDRPFRKRLRRSAGGLALAAALAAMAMPADAQTIRAVKHSALRVLDPIITTAYITRNHGYMIYDTLFAPDANYEVKPQMVDTWSSSDDGLTWTFTLRDGLKFHDGADVTLGGLIASVKRWGTRDGIGQVLMDYVEDFTAVDDKTFEIKLKKPYGLCSTASPSRPRTCPSSCPSASPRRPRSRRSPSNRLGPLQVRRARVPARRQGRLREEQGLRPARGARPPGPPAARS